MTTILVSVILRNNLEWMSILRHTPIADHHNSRNKALDREDDSQLLFSARNDAIVIRRVHDVAVDTSAEAKKLEGKLDALVNLVTQLAATQKSASVARFSRRNDAIVIRGVDDVATDTSAETRKLEGKLDALVNFVTQLAANQKPTSVARVCRIRSSNDHRTNVYPSSQQSGVDEHPEAYAQFSARNYAIDIRGVHHMVTDTSTETRKLESKLDALVNLVTQVAANQKPTSVARLRISSLPLLQESAASILPMTTIQVSILLRSNLEWMSILRLMLQTPIADHHSSRDKALDREDGSQLLAVQCKK
ncbi:LOW QUALITY PROTEIN: hypothetical protein Fmac_028689 [Flemingia macrophylla]|uniref:Uncharacterized protein n=1 Tax=Flemingia macrophylla TaxID=520843 RepID=A0ABD1L878_9FABA